MIIILNVWALFLNNVIDYFMIALEHYFQIFDEKILFLLR
jgi:hypothetical protein